MNRLIIAADIHGWYPCWQELTSILKPEDGLAVAGDLFDNVYGNRGNDNYWPEQIRLEWNQLKSPRFYVYGNCDSEAFFPHQSFEQNLNLLGRRILILHGHIHSGSLDGADIVVQGHTHRARLEHDGARIRLNPGSLAQPRDGEAGYAVMTKNGICLVRLRDHKVFRSIDFDKIG